MEQTNNINIPDIKLSIDSSSLTSASMSENDFENSLEEKVQTILNKEFVDEYNKRQIKITKSSINFACPFCRDSAKDPNKKRGHLILSGKHAGHYKCHNCFKYMSFQKFFDEFDNQLDLSEITYINKELNYQDISAINKNLLNITSEIINKEEAKKYAIDRELLKSAIGLEEIGRLTTPEAYNYLIDRCQYKNHERFLYNAKYKQIFILNLVDDKILGLQLRNIDPNHIGAKYLTMTIEKMREIFLGDKSPVPDSVSQLSCVFNVFNVDFTRPDYRPVLIVEGPFDAFLLPNCIAIAGASKNFIMQFPFWYLYDNDETGTKCALEKLSKGYHVFLWKKFKKDYNLPNRKKWDVTDVLKYNNSNGKQKILWQPYFTNKTLDGFYI